MSEINTVLLSGEVGMVKQKFTSDGRVYLVFTLKHKVLKFVNRQLAETSYMSFLCSCFDEYMFKNTDIRIGNHLVVQGSMATYMRESKTSTSITVEKIYVTRLKKD